MGDRANLVISFKSTAEAKTLADALPGTIVLYIHGDGSNLGPDVARSLRAAEPRWQDESYGARIIVSHMIGKWWPQEYGYGLLAGETSDNEHPVLLVDFEQQKVRLFGDAGAYVSDSAAKHTKPTAEWSFRDFAAMSADQAMTAHQGERDDD